jgi:ATP phosphoribosyltransferase
MNVSRKNLDKVLKVLTSLRNPTISPLVTDGWVALETVIDESTVRKIIPELKDAGAEGIIEYSLNKLIY